MLLNLHTTNCCSCLDCLQHEKDTRWSIENTIIYVIFTDENIYHIRKEASQQKQEKSKSGVQDQCHISYSMSTSFSFEANLLKTRTLKISI